METAWEELPDLALQRIMEYTDFKSRLPVRLVCKRWKNEIESVVGVGRTVRIDDRKHGMEAFVERTLIREACISFLRSQESILDSLSGVRTLIFDKYVHPTIFRNFMDGRAWDRLSRLFLCGPCLVAQAWPSTEALVTFPNLKDLEIRLPPSMIARCAMRLEEEDLEDVIPDGLDSWDRKEVIGLILGNRAVDNVKSLLKSIRSPVLRSFLFSATPLYEDNSMVESTVSVNEFLEAHAMTLEKLVLQQIYEIDFRTYEWMEVPYQPLTFSFRRLKSLYLSQLPPGLRDHFMRDLICTQEALEDLAVEFKELPYGQPMTGFLATLVSKNQGTLKYLNLMGNVGRPNEVIDLGVFQACTRLTSLKLPFTNGPFRMHIKNVNELPDTLEEFQVGTKVGTTAEFNGVAFIKRMRRLEILVIHCIHRVGHMEEKGPVSQFLQAALRHRTLCYLDLKFKNIVENGICFESFFGHSVDLEAKTLLNPLLVQIFLVDNEVEFESLYAGKASTMLDTSGIYRHYFDVAGIGNSLPYPEMSPPFHTDHELAGSYSVQQISCFGLTIQNYTLYSLTSSASTAFDLDSQRVDLGSGFWLMSKFDVQDSDKSKNLEQIHRLQELELDQDDLVENAVPVSGTKYLGQVSDLGPDEGQTELPYDLFSDGEEKSSFRDWKNKKGDPEIQEDGLPALEISQAYDLRIIKAL